MSCEAPQPPPRDNSLLLGSALFILLCVALLFMWMATPAGGSLHVIFLYLACGSCLLALFFVLVEAKRLGMLEPAESEIAEAMFIR